MVMPIFFQVVSNVVTLNVKMVIRVAFSIVRNRLGKQLY